MQETIALAVLGAMLAATLGGLLIRLFFAAKYYLLVAVWIMSFGASLLLLTACGLEFNCNKSMETWVISASGCTVFSVMAYFGQRNEFKKATNERYWRIGFGIFLLSCGTSLAMTLRWWAVMIYGVFGEDAYLAYLPCMLCSLVLGWTGISIIVNGQDNKRSTSFRFELELVLARFPFKWRWARLSPQECENRNHPPESAKTDAGGIESLFAAALGLAAPWEVDKVELSTPRRRIDVDLNCKASRLNCPQCGATEQAVYNRVLRKQWRHLDFFQYQVWLCANAPCVSCSACGKKSQLQIPWAVKSGST